MKFFTRKCLTISLLYTFIACGFFLTAPSTAHADISTTWSTTIPQTLYYSWNRFWEESPIYSLGWDEALGANTEVNVTYRANVINYETGQEITNGETVPVGTWLIFQREEPETGDVSWFGTGYTDDSPYGYLAGTDDNGNSNINNTIWGGTGNSYPYGGSQPLCPALSLVGNVDSSSGIANLQGASTTNDTVTATTTDGTTTQIVAPIPDTEFPTYIPLVVNSPGAMLVNGTEPIIWNGSVYVSPDNYQTCLDNTLGGVGCEQNSTSDLSGLTPSSTPYLTCPNWYEGAPANGHTGAGYATTGQDLPNDEVLCETTWPNSTNTLETGSSSPATVSFDFATTTGEFYYQYWDYRTIDYTACGNNGCDPTVEEGPGCYSAGSYSNTPLSALSETIPPGDTGYAEQWLVNGDGYYYGEVQYLGPGGTLTGQQLIGNSGSASEPTFTLTVPPQQIPFTFNVTLADQGPSAPIVTGSTSISWVFSNGTFIAGNLSDEAITAVATDTTTGIRYGFDWNDDGVVDQWVPASSYVNSGVSESANHTWTSGGPHTFEVLAQNKYGEVSPWTQYTVTVASTPPPSVQMNYTDWNDSSNVSQVDATDYTDYTSGIPDVSWTSSYATACQGSNDLAGANNISGSSYGTTTYESSPWNTYPNWDFTQTGTYTYTMTCGGPDGTTTKSLNVAVSSKPPTVQLYINNTSDSGTAQGQEGTDNYAYWNTQNTQSCTESGGDGSDGWSQTIDPTQTSSQDLGSSIPIGNYSYTLTCTNSFGVTASDTVPLVVTPGPPSVSCLTSADEQTDNSGDTYVTLGTPVTYTANASDGDPPYIYSWTGYDYDDNWNYTENNNISQDINSTIETTYDTSSYNYVVANVTDADGNTTSSYCTDSNGNYDVIADTPPTTPVVTGPGIGTPNTNYTFNAVSNDSDPTQTFYYLFYPEDDAYPDPNPSDWDYENSGNWSLPPGPPGDSITDANWSATGTYDVGAIAFDDFGIASPEGFGSITIEPNVPDSCSANENPASIGQTVTWTVSTSSSSPSYEWSGSNGLSSTGYQASTVYSTTGTKSASVDVTSNGITHTVNCPDITVNTGLPVINLSGIIGSSAPAQGEVVVSKTESVSIKLAVSNATLGCSATGDSVWAPHVNGLVPDDLGDFSDTSGISSPLTNSETLQVTCTNANGSATASLHVGLLSITEF